MSWDLEPPKQNELQAPQSSAGWDSAPPTELEIQRQPQQSQRDGAIVSGIRNLAQGYTGGFSDEFAGGVEAAGRALGLKGLGVGDIRNISLSDDGPTLNPEKLKRAYVEARDQERGDLKKDQKNNIAIAGSANLVGSLISPINKIAKGMSLAKGGAAIGAANALGSSESDGLLDMAKDTTKGALLGAVVGKGVDVGSGAIKGVAKKLSSKASTAAEKFAVNSTGATGRQSEKFTDDAGRQLLDRGLIKFGDSPEQIAERVAAASDKSSGEIKKAITGLDKKGAKVSVDSVVKSLKEKINLFSEDPSKAPLVKKLQGIIDDVEMSMSRKLEAGPITPQDRTVGLSAAEEIKRGYGSKIRNWLDPEAGAANKEAYRAYMKEVENEALRVDPSIASKFKEAKKTYGLLAPIEEAATKRASTLNQSPLGGLGDIASTAAGGGNPLYALGRRALAPRLSSIAAVSLDKMSKFLSKSPTLTKVAESNPKVIQAIMSTIESNSARLPKAAEQRQGADGGSSVASIKGETKWALDGYSKVLQQDPSFESEVFAKNAFSNPKAKMLLAQASELTPGSKAMMSVISQLKQIQGAK